VGELRDVLARLFVNGERYPVELDSAVVTGAIEAASPRA
jgi:hypothetical protein